MKNIFRLQKWVSLFVLWTMMISQSVFAQPAASPVSLNVWFASGQLDGPLKHLADVFNSQHSGMSINVVSIPNEDLKTSIVKTVINSNSPDIAILSSDNTVYVQQMALSEIPLSYLSINLPESIKQSLLVDGKLYSVPVQLANQLVLFYNKSLILEPATSWEQILGQASILQSKDILPVGVLFAEGYWVAHFLTLFENQFVVDNKPNLNTPEVASGLAFYRYLSELGVTNAHCGYDCVSIDFYAGKVAYAINGTWALADAHHALGDNLGVLPLPSYRQQPMRGLASSVVLTFPGNSWTGAKAKAVKAFTDFMLSHYAQSYLIETTLMVPANPANINQLTDNPIVRQLWQMHSDAYQMPASSAFVSIWNSLRKGLALYLNNTLDVDETRAYMQTVALKGQLQLERTDD